MYYDLCNCSFLKCCYSPSKDGHQLTEICKGNILYRDGGTYKDYRLRQLITRRLLLPTTPSVLQSFSYKQFPHLLCWLLHYRLTPVCHADSRTVRYSWRSRLSTLDCRPLGGWLQIADSLALTDWLTLRNSCLKVGMCGRYSEHFASPFIYAVYEFGWGHAVA
jgi:hypothetical protein